MRKLLCFFGLHRWKKFTGHYDVDGPGFWVLSCECGRANRGDCYDGVTSFLGRR